MVQVYCTYYFNTILTLQSQHTLSNIYKYFYYIKKYITVTTKIQLITIIFFVIIKMSENIFLDSKSRRNQRLKTY